MSKLPAAFVFPDNLGALAVSRELGSAGVPVTVIGHRRGPASYSRFTSFVEAPDLYSERAEWAAHVAGLAGQADEPPVLFPTEDAALLVADEYHQTLSPALRYSYAAPDIASRILDKRTLYAEAERAGVACPRFADVTDPADVPVTDAETAWLVKPACRYWIENGRPIHRFLATSGGPKALAGDLASDVRTILGAGFPAVVQERIPGGSEELVSVGLCLDRDGNVDGEFTARKHCEYPEPFGDGLIVERVADPGVVELAARVLRHMGYWGVCDVEFKRDPRDGGYKLLDANPRVWLWYGLATLVGVRLALAAYRLATDARVHGRTASQRGIRGGHPMWVSGRGTAGFLATTYRPRRHGFGLPIRLTLGALETMLRDLHMFHDPLYLQPAAWLHIAGAVARRTRKVPASGSAGGE